MLLPYLLYKKLSVGSYEHINVRILMFE